MTPAPVTDTAWYAAQAELEDARLGLAAAPDGIILQAAHDRLLAAERSCTTLVHRWFAAALELEPVREPRAVFSVDVDGVLEDDDVGFSSTSLSGAAALRLLQQSRVAVILNTARGETDVRDRVTQFELLGGVSGCGAGIWDAVYGQATSLVAERVVEQLNRLRAEVRLASDLVLHSGHRGSMRVSRIVNGMPTAIAGAEARRLLEQCGVSEITILVAPTHTDFIDRNADKASGLRRLREEIGLGAMPMAAMGDAACDKQMLQEAGIAFLPAATFPTYAPARRQRLVRSRYLGDQALWDAACHLVADGTQQRDVATDAIRLRLPAWLPTRLCRRPPVARGFLPRFTSTLASMRST